MSIMMCISIKPPFIGAALVLIILLGIKGEGAASPQWLPVPTQSLDISDGSVLDFSRLFSSYPAGKSGSIVVSADRLIFQDTGQTARFSCATDLNGPHITQSFRTHVEADEYAVQLRRHGYNLVRFHFVDRRLMQGRTKAFDFDPVQLDRFDYLLAALKRNGIYWSLDMMTDPNGAEVNSASLPSGPDSLKIRSNFDPIARAAWLKLVDVLFARKNPYTGLTPLEDPALAFAITVNENSLAFWGQNKASLTKPFPTGFQKYLNLWLQKKFQTTRALVKVFPELEPDESVEAGTVRLPTGWRDTSWRMRLFMEFISDKEIETFEWMTQKLRDRGFKGIPLAYDDGYPQINNGTRSRLPVVDVHGYIGRVPNYDVGQVWDRYSSFSNSLAVYRQLAAYRWLDRPFVVTEYGHPFFNPYRYEAGIVLPSIASMQGWGMVCRIAHSSVEADIQEPGAVGSGHRPIMPFSIGLDPVARAGETLATLLLRRGDVGQAKHKIAVPFGDLEIGRLGSGNISMAINASTPLARFGLLPYSKVDGEGPGTVILPLDQKASEHRWGEAKGTVVDLISRSPEMRGGILVKALRKNGILPKEYLTDSARNIYQSSTGEITFDGEKNIFSVVTPRTEAAAFSGRVDGVILSHLTVENISGHALVSASSLDGQPLANSKKILFVLVGDAVNSDMKYSDTARTTIKSWGNLPILLERVQAGLNFRSSSANRGRLDVLKLNGDVSVSSKLRADASGTFSFTLDTGAVPTEPTTFFCLELD